MFKIHNEKSNDRKITEFFQNNDSPVNKIGNKKQLRNRNNQRQKNITIIISI